MIAQKLIATTVMLLLIPFFVLSNICFEVAGVSFFEDGFENGDFSFWSSVVNYPHHYYSISTFDPKKGSFHVNLTKTSDKNTVGYLEKLLSPTQTSVHARFYWKAIQKTTLASTLLSVYDDEGLHSSNWYVDVRYDGDLGWALSGKAANGTWWTVWNETLPINEKQWYCVEVYTEKSAVANHTLWVDGVQVLRVVSDESDHSNIEWMLLKGGGGHWGNERTIMDEVIFADTYIGPEDNDITPPGYSSLSHNNTIGGQPTRFSCLWSDESGLGGFIFSTNNTGTWVNSTWTSLDDATAWSNITQSLNSTIGTVVQYWFYANDTYDNWNKTATGSLIVMSHGFLDTFNDDVIDLEKWTTFEKNNGTVSETNGRLEIGVEDPPGTAGYITRNRYDLSKCDIRVEVSNEHLCEASLVITLDGLQDHFWYSNDFYIVEKHRYTNETMVKTRVDGGESIFLLNKTWAGPDGILRIVVKNGLIYFYEDDMEIYMEPYRLSSYKAYVHIEANTWGPPEPGYYGTDYFDNFVLNTSPPSTPNVLSPNGGEFWSGMQIVSWTAATDSDGVPATYEVEYSVLGGSSWQPLATGISSTSYVWNTAFCSDSDSCLVRVRANDGAYYSNWDTADSTFTVDNTAPLVIILYPTEGELVTANTFWINGSVTELNKGMLVPSLNDTRFSLFDWDGTIFAFKNSTAVAEGLISLEIDFSDLAGNLGLETVSFFYAHPRETQLSVSLTSSNALVGYEVSIGGVLTWLENGTGIGDALIILSYQYHPDSRPYIAADQSVRTISTIKTASNGGYSATWFVLSSGYYVVEAFHPAVGNTQAAVTSANLVITSLDNYAFSVSSNSTISALNFNSSSRELNFTVSGPSGTSGYIDIFIAKTLLPTVEVLKIHFDGTEKTWNSISISNMWLIRLSYSHSSHRVTINLGLTRAVQTTGQAPVQLSIALLAILGIYATILLLRSRQKSCARSAAKTCELKDINDAC